MNTKAKRQPKPNRKAAPRSLNRFANAPWYLREMKNRQELRITYHEPGHGGAMFTLAVIPFGSSGYGHISEQSAREVAGLIMEHGRKIHKVWLEEQADKDKAKADKEANQ